MNVTRTIAPLLVLLTLSIGSAAAQDATKGLADGVYTTEQAVRGEELMNRVCSECHEPSEFDEVFIDSWSGAELFELYDVLSSTMPEDSPGSLTPQQYADALAYMFSLNGIPTGNEELKPDATLLRAIIIQR